MRRWTIAVWVAPVMALLQCTGEDPPFADSNVRADGGSSDGSSGASSGSSSSSDTIGDFTHFKCADRQHDVCDDMDEGDVGKSPPWKGAPINGTNQVEYTTDAFVSSTRALRMKSTFDHDYNMSPQLIVDDLKGNFATLTCDLDVRIETEGPVASAAELLEIDINDDDTDTSVLGYEFRLVQSSQTSSFVFTGRRGAQTDQAIDRTYPRAALKAGVWTHFHLEMTPSQASALKITVDDGPAEELAGGVPFTKIKSFELRLKVLTERSGWSILFDNLVCDRK